MMIINTQLSFCHHHHPLAQISLALSCHLLLSSIALSRSCISTELLLIGSSWSPYPCSSVWRGPPEYITYELALTSPAVSACLVYLIWMVFEMGGWCLYNCCFVGCRLQDLFNTACSILVQLPSSFLSIRLVIVHVVHPYSSTDMTAAWKKNCALFYLIGLTLIWLIVYQ